MNSHEQIADETAFERERPPLEDLDLNAKNSIVQLETKEAHSRGN